MRKKVVVCFAVFIVLTATIVTVYLNYVTKPETNDTAELPKYIFLFIGDGFGYSQMTLASQYKTTIEGDAANLAMLDFEVTGSAFTGSANSIITDSAASASSIASGTKTYNGYLNYDTDGNKTETIAEKLKNQLDFKIGIISSVNINHATPAAFYAHQDSRYNNGSIFIELLESGFDFFGGGNISDIGSAEAASGKSLAELLHESGYLLFNTKEDILSFAEKDEKIIAVAPVLDGSGTIPYAIDRVPDTLTIAELTEKCIDLLYNENGFFIMVEGGKIDWCGHSNDAASIIHEIIDFDSAIKKAVEFYDKHPGETLIIVTGDHETGGLSLGYSGTYTSTYMHYLAMQKISFSEFSQKIYYYRQNQTPFEDIFGDIQEYFGVSAEYDGSTNFYLDAEDKEKLRGAYEQSLVEPSMRTFTMTEYMAYGFYDPFTTTIINIINKKAGVTWGTYSHTFAPVPVLARGSGAELFSGIYHNSEIFFKLRELTGVE